MRKNSRNVEQQLVEFDHEHYKNPHMFNGRDTKAVQQHYVSTGWKEWRNPSKDFDTLFYYAAVSGVTHPGVCPLVHYSSSEEAPPRNRVEAINSGMPPLNIEETLRALPDIKEFFDDEYYTLRYPDVVLSNVNPLEHYLRDGWKSGRNPSKNFETMFYRERFMHNDPADICPLVHYVRFGRYAGLPTSYADARKRAVTVRRGGADQTEKLLTTLPFELPAVLMAPHFDALFYLRTYEDIATAEVAPFWHYLKIGWNEGRRPTPHFDTQWYSSQFLKPEHLGQVPPLLHMATVGRLAELPVSAHCASTIYEEAADSLWTDWLKEFLRRIGADTEIYDSDQIRRVILPMFSVDHYRARAKLDTSVSDVAAFLRYLTVDLPAGVPPGPMFSAKHYLSEISRLNLPNLEEGGSLFLHWLSHGLPRGASPTPAFVEAEYLKLNKDLQNISGVLFTHFAKHGLPENRRLSRMFTIAKSPTAHLHTHREPLAKRFLEVVGLSVEHNNEFSTMASFMNSGRLLETILDASAIEPDIGIPPRNITAMIPPWHDEVWQGYSDILSLLPEGSFDAVVLMPFCKLGGADFVGGVLASELSKDRRTLVLRTDAEDWARPDWFAPEVKTADISAHLACLGPKVRERILYSLILRSGAQDVYNVNSRLAFDTFETYGERLALSTRLHAYYFCSDRTPEGIETGYPVWYFSKILPHLTTAMIDNAPLAKQLIERFQLSGAFRDRVRVIYTPVMTEQSGKLIATQQVETAGKRSRKKVLWAGRFDRQKRFDLLIEIARLMPGVDFVAWGKAVLDAPPDLTLVPKNLKINGPFSSYEELSLPESDGWLYTSSWDGIPTILIELGSMGVPIVASSVGGVSEVIDTTTGWPILGDEDAAAYVEAIEQMLASADDRVARAAALQRRIVSRHSRTAYATELEHISNRAAETKNA